MSHRDLKPANMLLVLVLLPVLLFAGCVTGPVEESYSLKALGDGEVAKMRLAGERAIAARYAGSMGDVWREWQRFEARINAIRPAGPLAPDAAAAFARKHTETMAEGQRRRDAKLQRLDDARAADMAELAALHRNHTRVSSSIIKGWAAQGKLTARMVDDIRGGVVEGVQYYQAERRRRDLAKEAKRAAEREAAESEE